MAKEKQTQRMLAMALAASVATGAMPVTAFADVVTNPDGSTTETTTDTDTGSTTTEKTFHESEKIVSALVEVTTTEVTTTEDTWNGAYEETWTYSGNNHNNDPIINEETKPELPTDTGTPEDTKGTGVDTEVDDPGIVLGAEEEVTEEGKLPSSDEESYILSDIPKTGDESHVVGYCTTALAALAGIFALNKREKLNKR